MKPAALLLLLALSQLQTTPKSQLADSNPPRGLTLTLRTVDGRTTFGLSELIPLQVAYASSRPATYAIELAEGWNGAPADDRFGVEPDQAAVDRLPFNHRAFICCDSRRAFLRRSPAVYDYDLTDFVRFTEPGEYRVQFVSRRVFTDGLGKGYERSPLVLRSNIVVINIVPDTPGWVEAMLTAALQGVAVRAERELAAGRTLPARGTLALPPAGEALSRYLAAYRQLRMLDSVEAIRAKVAALRLPTVEEWRATEARFGGYSAIASALEFSSRPDLVVTALRARASAPDFGITGGYLALWHQAQVERDHPELFRPGPPPTPPTPAVVGPQGTAVLRQILDTMRELLPAKTALAAEITGTTIRHAERNLSAR